MKEEERNNNPPDANPYAKDISAEQKRKIDGLRQAAEKIRIELGKAIIGQREMIDLLAVAVLVEGHVLIEGVPGIAKTLTAKCLAKTLDIEFRRVQFTPDLMPSDIIGTSVFNPKTTDFEFRSGPLFSNVILIDEINRAPAKTQSALFEVMEERQITADGTTYSMSRPFIVIATQNPIDQEGTYRLPEAQLDRFLFKIEVGYPNIEEETLILAERHKCKHTAESPDISAVLSRAEIFEFRDTIHSLHIEEKLLRYICAIVGQTRNNPFIYLGASPRASLGIMHAAKAFAAIRGRYFVTPEDIKDVAVHVLRHRIMLTPEKEMEGETPDLAVRQIIERVEVPR
ncbi:MoxR family ATPase [Ignavibacteria bacterium]|nr:MoxR family ATPase [Bacteroidota bacterium]MCZ2133155.1 MoxR family ATPase [Bacteroidota bacterium]